MSDHDEHVEARVLLDLAARVAEVRRIEFEAAVKVLDVAGQRVARARAAMESATELLADAVRLVERMEARCSLTTF